MMEKPVLFYRQHPAEFIVVGRDADVLMVDHPRHGTKFFPTTYVSSYDVKTGVFETLDFVYKPEEKKCST